MKKAKEKTIDKKRRNKAMKLQKTEASRRRRIANKHRREEIHAIDPDMKVVVINQTTFDQHGTEIEVMNGKVRAITPIVETYNAESDGGRSINDQIEKERLGIINKNEVIEGIKIKNKSALERLTDRFKKK